jgi:hypothetical protein
MHVRRSALAALIVLSAALGPALIGAAEAGSKPIFGLSSMSLHVRNARVDVLPDGRLHRLVVTGDTSVASLTARIESDGGAEDVTLVETDAWLHGAATIAALPATDAIAELTLYDTNSVAIATFKGILPLSPTDLYFGRAVDDGGSTDAAECASRTGCTDTEGRDDEGGEPLDIEVLGATVFAARGGYDVAFDLAGADAYVVAYAALTVTATDDDPRAWTCIATDRLGECVEWSGGATVTTTTEVAWDAMGAVWAADLAVEHEGLVAVKYKARGADGASMNVKAKLGAPWLDGGAGVHVLAIDEDPLTTVGLTTRDGASALAVVSEGWTLGDALPTHAEVALTSGDTVTLPADSYQRRADPRYFSQSTEIWLWEPRLRIVIDGSTLTIDGGSLTLADLAAPLCADGTCVVLVPDEERGYALSVTQYRWDTEFESDAVDISVTWLGADDADLATEALATEALATESLTFTFDDEVAVVFSADVAFVGDPVRAALTGKVSLLGEANRRGKQETLAKGRFYATVARDGDGELGIDGVDKDEVAARTDTTFAILLQGAPSSCGDDDSGFTAPPPLAAIAGNGSGTKNASSQTSTRPELL